MELSLNILPWVPLWSYHWTFSPGCPCGAIIEHSPLGAPVELSLTILPWVPLWSYHWPFSPGCPCGAIIDHSPLGAPVELSLTILPWVPLWSYHWTFSPGCPCVTQSQCYFTVKILQTLHNTLSPVAPLFTTSPKHVNHDRCSNRKPCRRPCGLIALLKLYCRQNRQHLMMIQTPTGPLYTDTDPPTEPLMTNKGWFQICK